MSLRDIKLLSELIDEKINLGLDLDSSICHEFQRRSQDKILFSYLALTGFMNYLILKIVSIQVY